MHTRFHAILKSNRRFYLAVTVVFVLLVGPIVGYEACTLKRLLEIADQNFEGDAYLYCLNKTLEQRETHNPSQNLL